ncbi:hypothetical protein LHJ74_00575 [Streptomyces sp. N2-109]|uniref:Acyl-CoA carboxylase subunit epsilon n=1 Tax=Streptomyces gossypii TaxID=2883101 RepID=A0ABT2JKR1_9ACTN|nr:acyl-CoA carboxylase epsilon subunit [Streptomyces gossypii]MCT2588452.1 hypothetical protein [Streptomyces gossypii]
MTQALPAPGDPSAPAAPDSPVCRLARLLRVERGNPRPEELAALVALLYAHTAAVPPAVGLPPAEAAARWSRPGEGAFQGPRTWRARR